MISVGIDIQDIDEFRKKDYENNKEFYNKLFTDAEIIYCLNKLDPYQSFACRFCVKEAAIKAWGGISTDRPPSDIEIVMAGRKPHLFLNGEQVSNASISMSHTKNIAIATVILSN